MSRPSVHFAPDAGALEEDATKETDGGLGLGLGDLQAQLEAMGASVGALASSSPTEAPQVSANAFSLPPREAGADSLAGRSAPSPRGVEGARPSGISPRSPRLPILEALSQRRSTSGQLPGLPGGGTGVGNDQPFAALRQEDPSQLPQQFGYDRQRQSISGTFPGMMGPHGNANSDDRFPSEGSQGIAGIGLSSDAYPSMPSSSPRLSNVSYGNLPQSAGHQSFAPSGGEGLLDKLRQPSVPNSDGPRHPSAPSGDGLLEKLFKGLENKQMSVGDALGALEINLGKPATPRNTDQVESQAGPNSLRSNSGLTPAGLESLRSNSGQSQPGLDSLRSNSGLSQAGLESLRSNPGVSPRLTGAVAKDAMSQQHPDQLQSNVGLSPRFSGAPGKLSGNEQHAQAPTPTFSGPPGSNSENMCHRPSAHGSTSGNDVKPDPVETWLGSANVVADNHADPARAVPGTRRSQSEIKPTQNTPRTQEKCAQCEVLGMQVGALAQSLAGLGARVFNWATILTTAQHRALAELVLEYTRPCSHLDDNLKGLCGDIESVNWDALAATGKPTAKNDPPANPMIAAPRQTLTPDMTRETALKSAQKSPNGAKRSSFFRASPAPTTAALQDFFAESGEEDVDDDEDFDHEPGAMPRSMPIHGAATSIAPMSAVEPPAPLRVEEEDLVPRLRPQASASREELPPRRIAAKSKARQSMDMQMPPTGPPPLQQPPTGPPPLQKSPTRPLPVPKSADSRKERLGAASEQSMLVGGEMNADMCRAMVQMLKKKNVDAGANAPSSAPGGDLEPSGGGTGEPCEGDFSDDGADLALASDNVGSARNVFSEMMSPGTKAGTGEGAPEMGSFRAPGKGAPEHVGSRGANPQSVPRVGGKGAARPPHRPSMPRVQLENLRAADYPAARAAQPRAPGRDYEDSSDSDLHF